jgi:uncharacterized protein
MDNNKNKPLLSENRNPWFSFFTLVLFVLGGLFVGQFLGLILILPLFDFDLQLATSVFEVAKERPEGRVPLLIIQACSAGLAFIVAPLIYLYTVEKKNIKIFFNNKSYNLIPILATILITVSFMVVNSVFVEWNENIRLPESLAPFEKWAEDYEQQMRNLTQYLTNFANFQQFLFAMFVIAVIPAIGEELLFRGLIQNLFVNITRNGHLAIIITGFIFSAFHLQFYGLIPRMFLGILFGYLYVWSGSLFIPMLAHFVNNGLTITIMYLHRINVIEYDIEREDSVPLDSVFIFLIIGIIFLYYFKKYYKKKEENYE